jgi:hypothetical protein
MAGNLERVHDHWTEQRSFNFPELDPQAFLARGACDPQAQAARHEQRSQDDGKDAGEDHRADKEEKEFLEAHSSSCF